MWPDEPRTLPDWIERAYEILVSQAAAFDDGIPRDRASELLVSHDEFSEGPADAEYAIERLLDRGWLYDVDGHLRITDPDI